MFWTTLVLLSILWLLGIAVEFQQFTVDVPPSSLMAPNEFTELESQLQEDLSELKECSDSQRRRTILASMQWLLVEADSLLLSEMALTAR
jgi:hypothetical protein